MRRKYIPWIALTSTIAGTQIASAADLPLKAPAPSIQVSTPAYNWTGYYVGGNIGYGWGNASTDFSANPVIVDTNFGIFTIPSMSGSLSTKPQGVIGGGQVGYNWQFSPNWIAGVEADIQASGQKAANTSSVAFTVPGGIPSGTALMNYETKIVWFGTLRGRIGYAWERLLFYGTGGLAYGEVKLDGMRTVSGIAGGLPGLPFSISKAIGHSQVNVGWTLGAGVEGALVDRWTWKVEYLYLDLGSLSDSDAVVLPAINSVTGGQTFTHTKFTDNIVRIGLNSKFR